MKQQTIRRFAGISSTAEGYEVIFVKDFDTGKRTVKKYPVHSESMKRFYKVSNRHSDTYLAKYVPYHFFRKVWMN